MFREESLNLAWPMIFFCLLFQGPEELGMKWKREVRPAMGVDVRYENYPIMNDITTDAVTRQPGTSAVCPEYAHKSVLRLTISEDDDQRLYQCVVMSNNVETTSSAAKIEINNPGWLLCVCLVVIELMIAAVTSCH